MKDWIKPFKKMGACQEALVWMEDYNNLAEAWAKCERGDWMLWLLGKLSGSSHTESRKKLVLVACACSRLSLPYVAKDEERPLKAIETAEAWARGDKGVTLEDVKYAADAAYAAASAASAASAAYAADAAYTAASAAYASYATSAAYAAASAASAAKEVSLATCADIVRKYYEAPVQVIRKLNE